MTIQANKLKKEPQPEPKEQPAKPVVKKAPAKAKKDTSRFRNEKLAVVLGFLLIVTGIFTAIALTSYFFTWQIDFDKIETLTFSEILTGKTIITNITGSLGAALSHLLIYQWFGIGSYAFSFVLILFGIKLALKTSLLPLFRSFRFSFYFLIYSSLLCGFLFSDYTNALGLMGGNFGKTIGIWMINAFGSSGYILLLVFLFIAFTSLH